MFSKSYQFTSIIKTLLCLCHYGSSPPSVICVVVPRHFPWFGVLKNAAFLKYTVIALEVLCGSKLMAIRREESRQKHEHCLVNISLLNVTSQFLKSCMHQSTSWCLTFHLVSTHILIAFVLGSSTNDCSSHWSMWSCSKTLLETRLSCCTS